jgi:hypothetical protein
MLCLAPNRKLAQILAAANEFSGRGSAPGPEAEQRLKRRHRCLTPVVAEDEFIEIDLQMMTPDSVVGPDQPLLQVADGSMDSWQHGGASRPDLLRRGDVTVARDAKPAKRLQSIGVNRRAGSDVAFREIGERDLAEVGNHFHADASCPDPAFLHGDGDQSRFASFELATAPQPGLRSAHPCVVEFDVAMQRLARGVHHGASELVQQQPGGLVPAEGQLTLNQQRRDPPLVGRHQIGGPKPHRQRELGPVQDRARGQRDLVSTLGALATLPVAEQERSPVTTAWTAKALGPSTGLEILPARLLVRELSLKLAEARRERRTRHGGTLLMAVS